MYHYTYVIFNMYIISYSNPQVEYIIFAIVQTHKLRSKEINLPAITEPGGGQQCRRELWSTDCNSMLAGAKTQDFFLIPSSTETYKIFKVYLLNTHTTHFTAQQGKDHPDEEAEKLQETSVPLLQGTSLSPSS